MLPKQPTIQQEVARRASEEPRVFAIGKPRRTLGQDTAWLRHSVQWLRADPTFDRDTQRRGGDPMGGEAGVA